MAGVKDIRAAVETARAARAADGRPTLLFLDEVHRFNKAQQDTFLPYLEDGTLTFVGATTENPSFEVVSALLSRARVYVLRALSVRGSDGAAARRAQRRGARPGSPAAAGRRSRARAHRPRAPTATRAARSTCWSWRPDWRRRGGSAADAGDGAGSGERRACAASTRAGDQFYDQISALHKAVRGTDPDGALYWLCRMLDGGCDPLLHRAARGAHGGRGHRTRRSARAAL